jgi:hypothetical protein
MPGGKEGPYTLAFAHRPVVGPNYGERLIIRLAMVANDVNDRAVAKEEAKRLVTGLHAKGVSLVPVHYGGSPGFLLRGLPPTSSPATHSTTPSPRLQPPDATSPAAGICARAQGAVAMVRINVDTPSPRCKVVRPKQRLEVVNTLGRSTIVRLARFTVRLAPRQALTIDQPFGTYLAPGVHDLAISAYAGSGAELWLQS